MLTVFLTKSDVTRHARALHLLESLREALKAHPTIARSQHETLVMPKGGDVAVRLATHPSLPAFGLVTRTRGSDSALAARSTIQLFDSKSGALLAAMDASYLQSLRAALMGALAVDALARPDASTVAILGSGGAASGALKALRLVRSLERTWVYEPDKAANFELSLRLQTALSTSVRGTNSAEEAVASADLVVLTGEVPLPVDALKPGAHVTVLSADSFAEPPLPRDVLARAHKTCDARSEVPSWLEPLDADLGEVLAGMKPGRTSPSQLTVFASTGPAWLDLVCAWHAYEGAKGDDSLTRVDVTS
jgi:ornithine cyclodeaminase